THGATGTKDVEVEITGTNDAPVITSAAPLPFVASGLEGVTEAGEGGTFESSDVGSSSVLVENLDVKALLDQMDDSMPRAAAIAALWDLIDNEYTNPTDSSGYYKSVLNEASARLGIEYAKYLLDGGKPLLDITAKYKPD